MPWASRIACFMNSVSTERTVFIPPTTVSAGSYLRQRSIRLCRVNTSLTGGDVSKVVLQVLVMGPPGAGKSTLGKTLAAKLGYAFVEGDDLHSKGNRKKMIDGIVLNDVDRAPWLAAIGDVLNRWRAAETGVVPSLVVAATSAPWSSRSWTQS